MPYIGEDLVQCSSFVLRCALHMSRETPESNGETPHFQMEELFKPYHSNLSKYFLKRDSSFPFGIYVRALQQPWPDAGFLLEPLIEYAFGSTMLKNRKLQALQLLTALFRNTTALTALGPQLSKQLQSLLQHALKVITFLPLICSVTKIRFNHTGMNIKKEKIESTAENSIMH